MPYANPDAQRKAQREWAARHRQQRAAYQRAYRYKWQAWLIEQKTQPCVDCGGQFPSVCMDFHHCKGDKSAEINRMVNHCVAFDLILKEIEKCNLVCANCHRIRHFGKQV